MNLLFEKDVMHPAARATEVQQQPSSETRSFQLRIKNNYKMSPQGQKANNNITFLQL